VVCNDEPELYAVGTIECTPAYDPLTGAGQLALSCSDGDSYRYHVEETTVVVSGSSTVSLNNDYMPVVPVVTTTADTALSWKVGTDTFQKTVSAGTWEFPELELAAGKNTVKISGTGTTTFRYREGRL
jgi:phage-related protein